MFQQGNLLCKILASTTSDLKVTLQTVADKFVPESLAFFNDACEFMSRHKIGLILFFRKHLTFWKFFPDFEPKTFDWLSQL